MRAIVVASTICALAAVLCGPAVAAVDLLNGSAEQSDMQIGFYAPTGTGSMDNVREFDGRTLSLSSLEYLSSLGYSGPWQYSVLGRYLFANDLDAAIGLNYMNRFGLTYKTSTLTHRLEAIRAGDISLLGAPYTVTPASGVHAAIPVPIPNVNPGVDDNPTQNFSIERTVNDVGLRFMDSNQTFRLVASSWVQTKDGIRQYRGRWTSIIPSIDPYARSRKHVYAVPVHTETSQSTVGTDFRLGQTAVINYRYSDTKFGQGDPPGIANTDKYGVAQPLKYLTQINSSTRTSSVKARATVGDRLFFTGVYTNRKRINERASFVESHPAGMSIGSANAALTYLATDSLTLTARYRTTDQTSNVVPILSGVNTINNALDTKMKSSLFEATYSGIPRAFLKAGYERKDISRSTQLTHGTGFAEISPSSKADIVTGLIRYFPTSNLSLSANASSTKTDNAGYAGTPNNRKQLNANATYMVHDNLAVYGDYSSVDEDNNRVMSAAIPDIGTPASNEELRIEAAGLGYHNEMKTGTVGAWYSLNSKLVLDTNYSRIRTDIANLWILGVGGTKESNTLPNMVSYVTENNQWSTGLTYSMSPKWSFYGRYILSKSDGRGLLDTSVYAPGVPPQWLPVDLRQHTYVLGFAHDLSAKDRLSLDFSVSEYVDFLNSTNTGTYNIWRMAWSRQF